MTSLPPCRRILDVIRVNHQVTTWKRSHIPNPEIPNPTNHGWKISDGLLQSHWFDGNELPGQLVDIAARNKDDSGDDESNTKFNAESDVDALFIDSDNDLT